MAQMAEFLGLRGASSYQRYENERTFKKKYLPFEFALALEPKLEGKGDPPITKQEIWMLAGIERSENSHRGFSGIRLADEESSSDFARYGLIIMEPTRSSTPVDRKLLSYVATIFDKANRERDWNLSVKDSVLCCLMVHDYFYEDRDKFDFSDVNGRQAEKGGYPNPDDMTVYDFCVFIGNHIRRFADEAPPL